MAELPVKKAAANLVIEIKVLPINAANMTFLEPEAINNYPGKNRLLGKGLAFALPN